MIDDDELWSRCRRGDSSAMAELYRRHARALYGFAFRATTDPGRAEDVLSSVFESAWRRRSASIEPGLVRAWLYGIATNVIRNEQRSLRRRLALGKRIATQASMDAFLDEADLARRVDDQHRARALVEAVRGFPRGEREAIALCWWSGVTYEEAAAALGVPIGTIRSRLASARRRLQPTLQPHAALTLEQDRGPRA